MSELHTAFADLYRETAAYGLLDGPQAGYVEQELEVDGIPVDRSIETIVHATEAPPSITHVQFYDGRAVTATVTRAYLQEGIVTVERGYANVLDRLADTATRYEQAVILASMRGTNVRTGEFLLAQMVEDTAGFQPIIQS